MNGFCDKLVKPGTASRVLHPSILDRLVRQENAGCESFRTKEGEQRAELVFDHKGVTVAAAASQQPNRRSKKRRIIDEVDQVLQKARVGAFVNR